MVSWDRSHQMEKGYQMPMNAFGSRYVYSLIQSSADGSLWQLSAQESILQMINRPALQMLGDFVANPAPFNASRCLGIPVFLAVLNEEKTKGEEN